MSASQSEAPPLGLVLSGGEAAKTGNRVSFFSVDRTIVGYLVDDSQEKVLLERLEVERWMRGAPSGLLPSAVHRLGRRIGSEAYCRASGTEAHPLNYDKVAPLIQGCTSLGFTTEYLGFAQDT